MKAFLIIAVLAGLALAGYQVLGPGKSAEASELANEVLYTVKRDDLKITVSENGYLKARTP